MPAMKNLALLLLLVLAVNAEAAVRVGRGPLAAWIPMAGAWEGLGTGAEGAFTMRADVDTLFGGMFVMIRSTETRAKGSFEHLTIFTADGAWVYEPGVTHRQLDGGPTAEGLILTAGNEHAR